MIFEDLRGYMGYLVDTAKFFNMTFTNPHSYTKYLAILKTRDLTKSENFLEIGTFHGVTSARCAKKFKNVFTVEISPEMARLASARFGRLGTNNIHLIEGDGLKALPEVLSRADVQNVLIFLDGHPCGGMTGAGAVNEPAVQELEIIEKFSKKVNAIIVDDFRNFGVESDFPKKSVLLKQAEDLFGVKGYSISVQMDQLRILKLPQAEQKGKHA